MPLPGKIAILLCTTGLFAATANAETVPVTGENFAQAETAWNFNNWAQEGADQDLIHLREVAPVGPDAPTVRMNWDTLYSFRLLEAGDDGEFTISLPEGDLYQSAQVMDEDGFSPYFIVEPGEHVISVRTKYAFILFRTELKDRRDPASLEQVHAMQDQIVVSGFVEGSRYDPANYDEAQLAELKTTYQQEFLEAGDDYTFATGPGQVDQHILNLSHAAGWGAYPPELEVSNAYSSSGSLPGDTCLALNFEDPENRFFTSFTLYDADGFLIEGETHINSNMWEPNEDGSISIHFNCNGTYVNELSSGGQDYNYSVRNYGVSQVVLDGLFRPIDPKPVTD